MEHLVLLLTITVVTLCSVTSQATHHICNVSAPNQEPAGPYGSIKFVGSCDLTLTDITGKINIPGISSCPDASQLIINGNQYCNNGAVVDTLIEATDNKLEISHNSGESFSLNYYKVFELEEQINVINKNETLFEAVILSPDYPDLFGKQFLLINLFSIPAQSYVTFTLYRKTKILNDSEISISRSRVSSVIFTSSLSSPFSLHRLESNSIQIQSFTASFHPAFLLRFEVVTCDMKSIPTVENAASKVTKQVSESGLILPGTVSVSYTCSKGYELQNEEDNKVGCEYVHTPRQGRPDTDTITNLTTTEWIGTDRVICQGVSCGPVPQQFYIGHSNLTKASNSESKVTYRYGDKVTLSCSTGYSLSAGSSVHTIQCQMDGTWSTEDEVPQCKLAPWVIGVVAAVIVICVASGILFWIFKKRNPGYDKPSTSEDNEIGLGVPVQAPDVESDSVSVQSGTRVRGKTRLADPHDKNEPLMSNINDKQSTSEGNEEGVGPPVQASVVESDSVSVQSGTRVHEETILEDLPDKNEPLLIMPHIAI